MPLRKLASLRPNLLQYIPRRTPQPLHCSGLQRRLEVETEFIYRIFHLRGIPVGFSSHTMWMEQLRQGPSSGRELCQVTFRLDTPGQV